MCHGAYIFGDSDLSAEGKCYSEVQLKLQYDTHTWSVLIRATGGNSKARKNIL